MEFCHFWFSVSEPPSFTIFSLHNAVTIVLISHYQSNHISNQSEYVVLFQTMVFMEQLQDYVETAGAMLLMHGMY